VRIRSLKRGQGRVDGVSLDRFEPGILYDVGTIIGNVLLAEGWAEAVDDRRPAMLVPLPEERAESAILVVDDDPATRALLATILTIHGYAVQTAEDGEQALAMVRLNPPQLILLDLKMPRVSGAQFRERQQRLGRTLADIPVVVISGASDAETESLRLRARHYLPKPIDDAALLDVVRTVCGFPAAR
jgi:twitching motility two-component system response regulator PilH